MHNFKMEPSKHFMPWHMWIDETMDKYDERCPTRGQLLHRIVAEFVLPKSRDRGYRFTLSPSELRDKIATWAYVIDREHMAQVSPLLRIPKPEHRNKQADWELFERDYGDGYWAAARNKLGYADRMFLTERAGAYFWANIGYFVYRFINIDGSLIYELVDEEERKINEEERAFLISEGLLVEEKKPRGDDDAYYRDAGFYRGDRRYD
jgi:hypothetical protein